MKYKIGDKVKIKKNVGFGPQVERDIQNLNTNRIATISFVGVYERVYNVEEMRWNFLAIDIEKVKEIFETINNRFEILDLRNG